MSVVREEGREHFYASQLVYGFVQWILMCPDNVRKTIQCIVRMLSCFSFIPRQLQVIKAGLCREEIVPRVGVYRKKCYKNEIAIMYDSLWRKLNTEQ